MKGKIKTGFLILWIGLLVLILGCSFTSEDKMDFFQDTLSTSLSSENVKSIRLYSSEKEVKNAFGNAQKVSETEDPTTKYLIYDDIEIGVQDGNVLRYLFNDKYATAKGVTIGSTRADAIAAYGETFYTRYDTGSEIIGYFDKKKMMNLEFILVDNQVSGVLVEKVVWRED